MPDISKLVLPNSVEYDIKDAVARTAILKIPTLPTTAGNYVLNVTIVGNNPVYSWVEQSTPTPSGSDLYHSNVTYAPSINNDDSLLSYSIEVT